MAGFQRGHLWLASTRESFIALLPLTFFGVTALFLQHLPLPAYQQALGDWLGPSWREHADLIVRATHGVFGMALAMVVAINLTERLRAHDDSDEAIPTIAIALSALINFMLCVLARPLDIGSLGHDSMLLGLVVGMVSAELLHRIAFHPWFNFVNISYNTEPVFYYAIRLTPPVIAVGAVFFLVAELLGTLPPLSEHLLRPLTAWGGLHGGGALLLSSLATLINQSFWFLGIPGGHILDTYAGDLFAPIGDFVSPTAMRQMFNTFVLLGGAGSTLGLLLAIMLVVKEGPPRRVGQLSALPALFNINESLLYGLPIVLNPSYLLPFIGVPLLLNLLSMGALHVEFFDLQNVDVPWTTPPIVSGWLLTGSWKGAVFQLLELAISTALYLPFVRRAEAQRKQAEAQALSVAIRAIMAEGQQRLPAVHRHDQVGIVARGLLADLRRALDTQSGLSLVYQPKHDRAGKIKGVEALLRWTHPKHGPIIPPVIVALAEESGEIHRLGRWIAEEAIACKARWNERGFTDLTVAINVSPAQLTNAAMPTYLTNALEKFAVGADEIELEITESSVIPNSRSVDETLQRLSETGIRLSMDDFGMGYSSLLYMRRFQVHAIKIDGSLTKDVLTNSTNADIIRTIASLGRAQQVEVVAEFVETATQREMLSHLGCDLFQGYFHSPPLSEQKALAYFAHHRAIFADLSEPAPVAQSQLSEIPIKVQLLSRDENTTRQISELQATLATELRICPQESQVRAELLEFQPDVLIVDGEIGGGETRDIVTYVREKLGLDWLPIVVVNADAQLYESFRQALPGRIDYVLFKPLDNTQLTERLLALGRHLEFKRFNAGLLDQISEGVIVIDETGKIHSFNKAAEELFGWTTAEIIGRNVNSLMPVHRQEQQSGHAHRYEQPGQGRIIDSSRLEEGQRKDGTLFHMHMKVIDISKGTARRHVGIIRRIGD